MKYKPSGAIVTALREMKFDQSTMFEWQRDTQGKADVPPFMEFLDFVDLRARASETISREGQKCHSQAIPTKSCMQTRMTYATSTNIDNSCIVCGASKHPLYTCRKFRSLSSEQRTEVVRKNQLCYNCLQPDHFKPQCKSIKTCQKCRRPHHTLLHEQVDCDAGTKGSEQAGRDRKCSSSADC